MFTQYLEPYFTRSYELCNLGEIMQALPMAQVHYKEQCDSADRTLVN